MATGYTHGVLEGKVWSLAEYLKKFFISDGGADPFHEMQVDDYHQKQLAKAQQELRLAKLMSRERAAFLVEDNYRNDVRLRRESEARQKVERGRLESMLEKVQAWDTEGNEVCESIKTYAIRQLEDTIKWDCTPMAEALEKETPEEYIAEEIAQAERDIAYHTRRIEEEAKRVSEQNEARRILRKL